MISDKCIYCKVNISEQIIEAIQDSSIENFDGYYDNDSDTDIVFVTCLSCGKLNEVEHKDGMVIMITRGNIKND